MAKNAKVHKLLNSLFLIYEEIYEISFLADLYVVSPVNL